MIEGRLSDCKHIVSFYKSNKRTINYFAVRKFYFVTFHLKKNFEMWGMEKFKTI